MNNPFSKDSGKLFSIQVEGFENLNANGYTITVKITATKERD